MKFEVEKFLTLTALLAGAATSVVACSSSDTSAPAGGGSGGEAGAAQPQGGNISASAGESAGGAGGEGGIFAGGAPSEGGAPEGGAAEGGAAGAFACLGDGPAAESPCDPWVAAGVPDCGNEDGNFAVQWCGNLLTFARPAVLTEFNDCVTKVGDVCSATGVQGCADSLIGKGCTQADTAATCTFVTSKCSDGTLDNCPGILDLVTPDGLAAAESCMDPAGETFDATFSGTCEKRLRACLFLSL